MKIRESNDILENGEKIKIPQYDENGKEIINLIEENEKKSKYTWEKDGLPLMENLQNKLSFTNKENYILMQLFKNDTIPRKYHPKIKGKVSTKKTRPKDKIRINSLEEDIGFKPRDKSRVNTIDEQNDTSKSIDRIKSRPSDINSRGYITEPYAEIEDEEDEDDDEEYVNDQTRPKIKKTKKKLMII